MPAFLRSVTGASAPAATPAGMDKKANAALILPIKIWIAVVFACLYLPRV
jgi:hypothetical protein